MFRPTDGNLIETPANWALFDPIIPYGVFAVNSDGTGFKLGDGVNVWSSLSYQGSNAIRNKQVQSSREPANNELLIYCDSTDKWIYRLQHCFDTVSNWESNNSVFPTSTLLIETANLTSIPTGRFKIGDGVTTFDALPWFGTDFATGEFSVGQSIEFNGQGWDPVTYLQSTDLQSATVPTGLFHRDDGSWAAINVDAISGPVASINNEVVVFDGVTGKIIKSSGISYDELLTTSGITTATFQINNGVKLIDVDGSLHIKDSLDSYSDIRVDSVYAEFASVQALLFGTGPSEITSVNLTTDGNYLFVDGGRVYTHLTDGDGSGLDADTVDGYHANSFLVSEFDVATNNLCAFGTTGFDVIDSGYAATDFATTSHTHSVAATTSPGFLPVLENTTTKYLRDDGTWQTISGGGSGDVTGPATSIIGNIVIFNSTDGKSISDSGSSVSDFATTDHTQFASTVTLLQLGSPTYNDTQDFINSIVSSGRISGGVLSAHATADGTIDISALTGFIKIADTNIAETRYFDLPATTISLTDNYANYIYVDYNGGTPQVLATTDRTTIKHTNQFTLGRAFRSGTTVDVLNSGINLYNRTRLTHEKWIDTFGGISYASGLMVTFTGLKPAYSAGTLYAGSNKLEVDALDCNATGTFTAYYTTDNGTTWTTQTDQTDLNNTQYNDVTTGLATLSNNSYGVHWLYICPNGCMMMLYGKASYTLAQAQVVASPVTPLPNMLSQWGKLAAKIIILKGASTPYSITHAWSTAFPVQAPGDHNSLAGLQGGTSSEYYHLTAEQYTGLIDENDALAYSIAFGG